MGLFCSFLRTAVLVGLTVSWARAESNLPTRDTDFGCTPKSTAEKYVDDFNIDVRSFGGLELCNSKIDTKKLFNDLQIVEFGSYAEVGDNKLILGFVSQNQYYSWLKSQTRGIERGDDIPYATAYNSGGYFTMQDGWAQLSTLGRVGTLIHEARHTSGYRHRRCTFGPYANTPVNGCDRNYSEGGSHGVEMEYYARVSVRGSNFHPLYKTMARLMAMGRANMVFNQSPISKKMGLSIYNPSGNSYVLDGTAIYERQYPVFQGQLKTTSFGSALFDGIKSLALEVYENLGADYKIDDDYSYYKLLNQQRGQGAEPLVDFEEIDNGHLRYVFILNQDYKYSSYDFSQGKFLSYQNGLPAGGRFITRIQNGEHGLFYLDLQNRVYQLNFQQERFIPTEVTWDSSSYKFFNFNKKIYMLTHQNRILELKSGKWVEDEILNTLLEMDSQITELPIYDAFEVKL